jgi:hypothetical protein
MAEENKKSNIGSISMKNGRATIVIDKEGTTEEFGLYFVVSRMRASVRGLNTPYGYIIRGYANVLTEKGLHFIPALRVRLKTLSADRRQGIRDLCKQWDQWLNYVSMMSKMKSCTKESPNKKYRENYEKVFA